MFTTLLLSVVTPIFTDFIKSAAPAISRKFFGESVDDTIKLASADTQRLTALAALDVPGGTPSLWVVNLRASFRYIAAGSLILGGLGTIGAGVYKKDPAIVAMGLDMACSPFGFIFGERLVLSYKGK